jgi:hypothetical protein
MLSVLAAAAANQQQTRVAQLLVGIVTAVGTCCQKQGSSSSRRSQQQLGPGGIQTWQTVQAVGNSGVTVTVNVRTIWAAKMGCRRRLGDCWERVRGASNSSSRQHHRAAMDSSRRQGSAGPCTPTGLQQIWILKQLQWLQQRLPLLACQHSWDGASLSVCKSTAALSCQLAHPGVAMWWM